MDITGVVKTVNREKGFGFITPDTPMPGGKDVFFHRSSCGGAWHLLVDKVTRVACTIEQTDKGPRGNAVRLL